MYHLRVIQGRSEPVAYFTGRFTEYIVSGRKKKNPVITKEYSKACKFMTEYEAIEACIFINTDIGSVMFTVGNGDDRTNGKERKAIGSIRKVNNDCGQPTLGRNVPVYDSL